MTDLAARLLLPTPGFSTRKPLMMHSALAGTWMDPRQVLVKMTVILGLFPRFVGEWNSNERISTV